MTNCFLLAASQLIHVCSIDRGNKVHINMSYLAAESSPLSSGLSLMSDYMLSLLVLVTNVSAQSRARKEAILVAVSGIHYYKQRKIALYLSPITGPVSLFLSPLSAFLFFSLSAYVRC